MIPELTSFVGRRAELDQFESWVSSDPEGKNKALLLIGSAGMGKSWLLKKFSDICSAHAPETWISQYVPLNKNQSASSFLERILQDTHRLFRGTFLSTSPNDQALKRILLEMLPSVGKVLASLVSDDKRPGWERYVSYLHAISEALKRSNGRYTLLIDPYPVIHDEQIADWHSIAQNLPPGIRIVIAQRPDDAIASDSETPRFFQFIPKSGSLSQLEEAHISQLYEHEFGFGRLKQFLNRWPENTRTEVPKRAYARYQGYPLAHDALIRLLITEGSKNPAEAIQAWPPQLAALLNMLWKSLVKQGSKRQRAALALQTFAIPAPVNFWAKTAGMAEADLARALCDPRFAHFFAELEPTIYAPFHQLFAERIEAELTRMPSTCSELTDAAWHSIEGNLEPKLVATESPSEFCVLAATSLAKRIENPKRVFQIITRITPIKVRLGLLDSAIEDNRSLLNRYGHYAVSKMSACCALGALAATRGEFAEAEKMYSEALAAAEKLSQPEGIAGMNSNLAHVYKALGNLTRAEEKLRAAHDVFKQIGDKNGEAATLGSIGVILEAKGDIAGAERAFTDAIEFFEGSDDFEKLAVFYGNLGSLFVRQGQLERGKEFHLRSLAIEEKLGAIGGIADSYSNLALISQTQGNYAEAEALCMKSLEINKRLDRLHCIASNYSSLGAVYQLAGRTIDAEKMFELALEIERQRKNAPGIAMALGNLGNLLKMSGDLRGAMEKYQHILQSEQNAIDPVCRAITLGNIGGLLEALGDPDEAEKMFLEALSINERLGRREGVASAYNNLAVICRGRGDEVRAREFWLKAREVYLQMPMPQMVAKVDSLINRLDEPNRA